MEKSSEKIVLSSVKKDTIILHDTTFVFKGDSAKITATVAPDINGEVNMPEIVTDSPRTKLSVSITKGKVIADCICKELEQKVTLQEHRITELTAIASEKQREKIVTKTIEVRFIPRWVKILAWIGGINSLALIIYIAFKIYLKVVSYGKI
jgi:hypothetical protein